MKKIRYSILFISTLIVALIIPSGMALSQNDYRPMEDVEAFRSSMISASENSLSIASDFEQMKHLSFLEEDVKSRGIFYFQKENKLRWEYSDPFYYLIIFNNDTVLIQDENNTNVYDAASGKMFRQINEIMLSMVSGSILESDDFEFEYFEKPSSYKLELRPLDENMKEFLSKIHLFINKKDITVDELLMLEKSGDYTRIRFINKRLNEEIPQHTFDLP